LTDHPASPGRGRWGFFLYDFANSGYVVVFGTFLFPIFFRDRLFPDHPRADLYWGLCVSSSVVVAGLLAPLVGHSADRLARRSVLGLWVACVFAGIVGLTAGSAGQSIAPAVIAVVFVLTHASYVLSVAVCDSYLSQLGNDRAGVSSFAWGFGYLGGVVCLAGVLLVQGTSMQPRPVAFGFTAAFFALFASLSLALLPHRAGRQEVGLLQAVRRVVDPNLLKTLAAFWLINEGIVTVMFFTALFGRETLQLDIRSIGAIFVGVQLLAFPGTWAMGRLARRLGTRTVIAITVIVWCVLLTGLSVAQTVTHFAAVSLISALVLGSTQALMRAHYSRIYPQRSSGLSFGLYALVTKSSTVVGPLAFGLVASATGSQRVAVLTTLAPLLAGLALFLGFTRSSLRSRAG